MALIKCKECGTEVSSKAETCPKCGARIAAKPMGCGTLIGVIFLGGIIISVFSNIFSSGTGSVSSPPSTSSPPTSIAQKADTWTYGESKDEMRGTVSKHATTESINTVNFDFPYQGVQHGTVMVYENGVLFYVKKGQVICNGGSEYGTCVVLVKFDDGKARYVKARKSGDDSTTIAFTEPSFLKNMKRSNKLMMQVEVFQNGLPVFEFDVSGLDKNDALQNQKGNQRG